MHYQVYPFAQEKLVSCIYGEIYDVIVDLRPKSISFKTWISVKLDAEKKKQLFIPKGFAHGFLTLSESSEVLYKISGNYSSNHERSLKWDDDSLKIDWPLDNLSPILSTKDKEANLLSSIEKELNF